MANWFGGDSKADTAEQKQFPVERTDAEWKQTLSTEQFRVLRQHATERPGSSPFNYEKRTGIFACAGCDQPLFTSDAKYESGSGWPSFFQPIEGAVETQTDSTLGMVRTEAHCSKCGGHLGHVFPDGPRPTGERYCMNGMSLTFQPD